jgi:gliding motility-associated-like protein/uncharacterized repeat protein (TIGR01451 family)
MSNGAVVTYTVNVDVPSDFIGNLSNTVVVTNPEDPTPTCTDCTDGPDTPDEQSDIATVKTNNSSTYVPGTTVAYTITVTNNGPSAASNVAVSDTAPSGTTISSWTAVVSTGSATLSNASGTGDLAETITAMSNGAVVTYTVNVAVPSDFTGNLSNTVVVNNPNDPDPTCTDCTDTDTPEPVSDLVTVKTLVSGNDEPMEADTVTFTISVTNNGPSQATNVSLTDLLPAGMTATSNNGFVSAGTYDSVSGLWSIGVLNVGASVDLTIEGTVDIGEDGNTITNTTTSAFSPIQIDPTTDGDDLSASFLVNGCLDTDGDGNCDFVDPNPNDPCDFDPEFITEVLTGEWLVTDCDGDGETNGEETTNGTDPYDPCDGGNINNVDLTDTTSLWYLADCDGDGVINGTEVDSDGDGIANNSPDDTDPNDPCDFNSVDITLPVTTSIVCTPVIEVTKTADVLGTDLGDSIVYTIEVANLGNVVLEAVTLEDLFTDAQGNALELTSAPVFIASSLGSLEGRLLVGEVATYEASFVINSQAINAGGVSNTVLGLAVGTNEVPVSDISDDGDDFDGNMLDDPTETDLGCLITFSLFSPNGDGVNDTFVINCIDNYPNNTLEIYNRWGNLVYKKSGYNNEFDGTSNGRSVLRQSEQLPVGTYYYVLNLGDGSAPRVDWLYINR